MKNAWDILPDHPSYDLSKHRAHVQKLHRNYPYITDEVCIAKVRELTKRAPPHFLRAAQNFTADILEDNTFFLETPTIESTLYLREMQQRLTTSPEPAFRAVSTFLQALYDELPDHAGTFHVPLGDLIDQSRFLALVFHTFYDLQQFHALRGKLYANIITASGYDPKTYDGKRKLTYPKDDPNVAKYLAGTPFIELLTTPIPFAIPIKTFAEHGFLFAKSGHGKSQTMRGIFASLLDQDCALFLLDGNGALIENVDKIASIKDRVVILDPEESPALNFFSMHGASREKRMELFFYLFKAIDQGLTERQATMVSYLVELMQSIQGATLDTLREVCESKAPKHSTASLEPIARDFFANQFYSKDALINQTKAQIAARLYTIGRNRLFNTMFSAPENRFNALQLMQDRKIVIVNTTRDKLGDQGSAVFGRYILAQCLAAAWQRPKHQRHVALIMLDEAKTYLDDQSKKILSDARAFGLGLLLASQFPDQLEEGVRKEVINNTSVKFAGPAAYSVVGQLNRDMRCDVDFIMNMKKRDYEYAEWACYVDNLTPRAIRLTMPFGTLEKLPQMTADEHAVLRKANRDHFTATTHHSQHKEEPRDTPQPPMAPRDIPASPIEYDTDI